MSGRRLPLVSLLLVVLAGSSFFYSADSELPGPDPVDLWQYIMYESPYRDSQGNAGPGWQGMPGLPTPPELFHADEDPHGDRVRVYVNERAVGPLSNPTPTFRMRYGSIMVKENHNASGPDKLLSLTVMYKVQGFRQTGGGEEWFWVMYNPCPLSSGGCTSGQPCPGGKTCPATVVTLSDKQPFISGTVSAPGCGNFSCFKGEVQFGKPWFCLSCHQAASEPGPKAYGDYVWMVNEFPAAGGN